MPPKPYSNAKPDGALGALLQAISIDALVKPEGRAVVSIVIDFKAEHVGRQFLPGFEFSYLPGSRIQAYLRP